MVSTWAVPGLADMGLRYSQKDEWIAIWRAVLYLETGRLPSILDGLTEFHKRYQNGNWPEDPTDSNTVFTAIDECAEFHKELGLNPWNLSE